MKNNQTRFIYDIFNIKNADFYNIDINNDNYKFLKPYTIGHLESDVAIAADATAVHFFNNVRRKILSGNRSAAINVFSEHLKEPKETCFGYSKMGIDGRGIKALATDAMNKILNDPCMVKEITRIEDMQLYVDKIMYDRVSDIYTNVIRKILINYTHEQCIKYKMTKYLEKKKCKPYWDMDQNKWVHNELNDCLVINGKHILLVPQAFLKGSFGPSTMYRHEILPDLIKETIKQGQSSLIKERKDKSQYISIKDMDKDVRSKGYSPNKTEMLKYAKLKPGATEKLRAILEEKRKKKKISK